VRRFARKVDDLAGNGAFREAVAITSVSGVTWAEAMGMPRSVRHAYLTVYAKQNPPLSGGGGERRIADDE